MKNLIILFLILGITHASLSLAQDQLKITIRTEKNAFQLGEPIVIYSTITNNTQEQIQVFTEIRPETDIYHFLISSPKGQTKTFHPIYIEEPDVLTILGPNEQLRDAARLFYSGKGYSFPEAGNYKVQLRSQGMASNLIDIKILTARTDAEKEQAKLVLEHPELGFFLMIEGSDVLADAQEQIEILRRKYMNSLITPYFLYGLGKNYSVAKRNFMTKQAREADLPKAIEILESIKNAEMQLFYRNKVFLTLAGCLKQQGKIEEARIVLIEWQRILEIHQGLKPFFNGRLEKELNNLK